MGRAAGRTNAAATVTAIGASTRGAAPHRLDPELDSVWLTHRTQLLEATSLLRSIDRLSEADRERLCMVMEQMGPDIGLPGPWRVVSYDGEHDYLAYYSRWEERMPDALNEFDCHPLADRFDGGLIDNLPEPRHLGRCLRGLAQQLADDAESLVADETA